MLDLSMAKLLVRADDETNDAAPVMNPTMIALLVVLLVLLVVAGLLVAGLLFMRQRRRARKQVELDGCEEDEKRLSSASTFSHRVTDESSESIYVYEEKKNLMDTSDCPSPSPLPQITITFPEEYDESGKRRSGRVVVVRVGDAGVALESSSEDLPAYQKNEADCFHSIDLQRVGGLVERARNGPSQKI